MKKAGAPSLLAPPSQSLLPRAASATNLAPPPAPIQAPMVATPDAKDHWSVDSNGSDLSDSSNNRTDILSGSSRSSIGSQSSSGKPDARKDTSVRVAVRIRPLLPREIATNEGVCVEREGSNMVTLSSMQKRFTFDHVFPISASQNDLYEEALQPLMDSFLQGFNVTVIAYGQTGSGKTFTMGNSIAASAMIASRLLFQPPGAAPWTGNDVAPSLPVDTVQESEGLIPRFLHQLFAQLKETESAGGDHVSVSFLEIYGEEIHDLLSEHARQQQDDGSQSLQLRENKAGVWVQGLTEVKVSNRRDALEQMRIGSLRRVTGSTEMNEHSSRSHAVYTVKIVRRINRRESLGGKAASTLKAPTTASLVNGKRRVNGRRLSFDEANGSDADAADATIVSKLTFVDLAGSERLKKTHAEGNRMKEGIQINVGLLALGNVINALGDKKSGSNLQTHVPYRSSKLTRLLQDALGGNSRTLFIACVSPAGANSNETLNTLQYANRAKNIQNKAVKNIDSRSAELLGLKAFNELLRRELVKARFMQAAGVDPSQIEAMVDMMLKDPAVLAYLKRLEQIAASSGVEAYGSDIRDETEKNQALLSRLSAHLSSMLSDRENGGDGRQQVEFDDVDAMSDGESVVMMEDKVGEVLEDLSPFSLAQLCQTLEVISTSLEIQSIWSLAARKSSSIESKVSRQDVKIRQKKTIADALEEALARMATWVAASSDDDPSENERTRQMNACQNKLSEIKSNITKLAEEKSIYLQELQDHSSRTKRQVLLKQDTIDQLRKTSQQLNSEANTNPLDILIRSSEIKNRFKIRELVDVSHFLEDGEKTMAEYLDEEIDAIAHLPSLFAKSDCPIASSEEIFLSLRDELQNTLDFEDLEASLSKELRNRARIVQGLTNGWLSCQERDGFLNENEFLSANEQKLKQCEGNIRYLSETIRSQSKQEKHLATMVESLASLDTAKSVVKRLLQELYSQKRLMLADLATTEDNGGHLDKSPRKASPQRLQDHQENGELHPRISNEHAVEKSDLDNKLDSLVEEHNREMIATLNMVTHFSGSSADTSSSKNGGQLAFWAQKCAAAGEKMLLLDDKSKTLQTQLDAKDKELESLRNRVIDMEAQLKTSKVKEEAFLLLDRCQGIWTELGLNAEDQAGKFRDINALLLKKCSEELEGLESARARLQDRIDDAYKSVKKLEDILVAEQPIDLTLLQSVAGKALLTQERYLLEARKSLEDELTKRFHARIRGLVKIRELMTSIQLERAEDLRHVSVQDHSAYFGRIVQDVRQLHAWEGCDSLSPADLLNLLTDSRETNMALATLRQDDLFLNALLIEKSKRLMEAEDQLKAIRSVVHQMELTQEQVLHVVKKAVSNRNKPDANEQLGESDRLNGLVLWIHQKGGNIDVSSKGLGLLSGIRESLIEIYDGRSNAITYLHSTLEEAMVLTREILGSSDQEMLTSLANQKEDASQAAKASKREFGCTQQELISGKTRLTELGGPVEKSLRALLLSMDDDFMAFGIETDSQRTSFFLGSDEEENNATRRTLERYIGDVTGDGIESVSAVLSSDQNSFLSELDPSFDEFGLVYSADYGKFKLDRLKESITDVTIVQRTIQSAQKRLDSLKKIMKLFNEINEFKKKIGQFEANASQKDRLFGSSLRLLEEEKFRRMAAKRYPNLLSALRKEVEKWLQNEEGEFDLSILGKDLKKLLLDMMNTDTGLMHLDLGVVDSARPSSRRQHPKAATPTLSNSHSFGASSTGTSQNATSAPPRSRSMTVLTKDSGAKKRLAFEQ